MNREALLNRTDAAIKGVQAEAVTLAKRLGLDASGIKDFYDRSSGVNWLLRLEAIHTLLKDANAATSPAAEIPTPADVAQGHTVAELLPIIAEADADQLDRIEQAEKDGKDRAGVHNAIEKRRLQLLEELENEAPEDGPDPDAE
jgi:3-hydroxyisobutyrate dehydrogenase-like beta-hydroxyacid dehydrogenase